jgi:DNA-binding PadR family transcriptional regulator
VRLGLLAVFADGPKYGYQLRTGFDARTAGTWPLNAGQVYMTLERLARDGLVQAQGVNSEGRSTYGITDAGQTALRHWFRTPLTEAHRSRDELTVKLLMAATTPGVDVSAVVQRQRTASMHLIRDYGALRRETVRSEDVPGVLWLDSVIFALEGEVRWLDHLERQFCGAAAT